VRLYADAHACSDTHTYACSDTDTDTGSDAHTYACSDTHTYACSDTDGQLPGLCGRPYLRDRRQGSQCRQLLSMHGGRMVLDRRRLCTWRRLGMDKRLEPDCCQPMRWHSDSDAYSGSDAHTDADAGSYADSDSGTDAYSDTHPDRQPGIQRLQGRHCQRRLEH